MILNSAKVILNDLDSRRNSWWRVMGLNVRRDPLCLIQISSGNSDAHVVQLNRDNYNAPNLVKILADKNIKKLFHFARSDLALNIISKQM